MLSEEQKKKLNADLPREDVRTREGGGGKALSYIEGWRVIDVLNDVFGPGGWSYDCTAKEERRDHVKDTNDKGQPRERWFVTHTAKCVLKVGNCTIGDHGAGHGIDRDLGAAIESSIKEACTDALKRCAKSLGRRLGLALYDKDQEHVTAEVPGPSEAGQKFIDEARAAEGRKAQQETWARARAAWATLNAFDRDTLNAIAKSWSAGGAS